MLVHKLTFDRGVLLATIDIMVQPHTIAYSKAWVAGNPSAANAWSAMETYITAAYRLMEIQRTRYILKGGLLTCKNRSASPTYREPPCYNPAHVRSV